MRNGRPTGAVGGQWTRQTHPERYVAGGLPDLPFEADSADLALVANLLFVYDDRLDREFHAAALRELARVAREEVRVFPLASLDRTEGVWRVH